jgi:hypothetical protein
MTSSGAKSDGRVLVDKADIISATPSREGVTTLADGRYDAYVRKVDPDRDLIVVDLVQVFTGNAAVRAALEDGRTARRPRSATPTSATRTTACGPWRWPAA